MANYAARTTVSPENTQASIKKAIMGYGADEFGIAESRTQAMVTFKIEHLHVRVTIDLPEREGYRSESATEQAVRQRWRALLLVIKAKLEAVDAGVSTLESEFLPFVVMADNRTLGEHIIPRLAEIVRPGVKLLQGKCS